MAHSQAPSNGDSIDTTKEAFVELCRELNMDFESQDTAWASYKKIDQNYVLEGDKTHWMACALYIACRQSAVPTTDKSTTVEGNCVSLTSLLKKTNLRLHHFFQKMKKWLDMINLGSGMFRERIEMLEKNFHVTSIVFKKTEEVFYTVFKDSDGSQSRTNKARARKKPACSVNDLFNFSWTLYVRAKGNFPTICDDLVNSFHLLLCCVDLMFLNSLVSKVRRDLLNPTFEALPEEYMTKDFNDDDWPSAIDVLCSKHKGIHKESKEIREHHWKPFIRRLIANKALKGNQDTLTGLLDAANFEYNLKHLNQDYDEFVLSSGEIDERIFLGEEFSGEIGTPSKFNQSQDCIDESSRSRLKRNLHEHFDRSSMGPLTPLTGRKHLKDKDSSIATPITNATQSVSRLQNNLLGYKAAPSEVLSSLFAECGENPQAGLEETISKLETIFQTAYCQPSKDRPQSPCSTMEFANNRWKLALVLFYKILERILKTEKRIYPTMDVSNIVSQELFVRTLMACCLEIIICSYNSQKTFPWILRPFDLSPFHFYKIIEVVIREEEGLSRSVVKHLNRVEENILEKLAWEEHSALYDALHSAGNIVPSCESVCFSQTFPSDASAASHSSSAILSSPSVQRPNFKIFGDKVVGYPVQQSPTTIPLADRFSSNHISTVKRSLFSSGQSPSAGNVPSTTTVSAPTTITVSPKKPAFIDTLNIPGNLVQQASRAGSAKFTLMLSIISPSASPNQSPAKRPDASPQGKSEAKQASPAKQLKKINSLGLFFRKVYHLASIRLIDLCSKLGISAELQQKIWTCFEYALIHRLSLMKDRHLDQMLMCAIYVMSKVTKEDKTFHDIMKCYRQQPQANSEVYRYVLISRKEAPKTEGAALKGAMQGTPSTPHKSEQKTEEQKLTPTRSTRSATRASKEEQVLTPEKTTTDASVKAKITEIVQQQRENEEKYGDLIEFYNLVYVKELKDFALKFAQTRSNEALQLSPLPIRRKQAASPRKVSNMRELYVSPIKNIATTPRSHLLYCFEESPAERLLDINRMIKGKSAFSSRRRISGLETDEDSGPSPTKKFYEEKLQALKPERNHR